MSEGRLGDFRPNVEGCSELELVIYAQYAPFMHHSSTIYAPEARRPAIRTRDVTRGDITEPVTAASVGSDVKKTETDVDIDRSTRVGSL